MHVSIRLPKELISFVGGLDAVEVDANTVGEALAAVMEAYPELERRVRDRKGKLYPYLAVVHEGQTVDLLSENDRPLAPDDTIELLGIASGG